MTATQSFIHALSQLKAGDLGLLRTHAGQGIDESVEAFDLFAGLWWPLRQTNERAPRREVAWLIAKLYACCLVPHSTGQTLARQLGRSQPNKAQPSMCVQKRFDRMLKLPIDKLEPALREAIDIVISNRQTLDWVQLTDDLSAWERESTRLKWAREFLYDHEGDTPC